ncbi:MAG: hypothetical protein Tsb0013_09590 [Phycisphaerales bacterium]
MPASRSRTTNWRRSLEQIHERGGCLEITLARYLGDDEQNMGALADQGGGARDIVWRVRILSLSDEEIVLEEPVVLGRTIDIEAGSELACIIAVGQNRWMFKSKMLGKSPVKLSGARPVTGLRVHMPEKVERCQRREFYRVNSVGVRLPEVICYPMRDPATAIAAEAANRQEFIRRLDTPIAGNIKDDDPDSFTLPEVGPPFAAKMMNIGGGGVGLVVQPEDHACLETARFLWLRIDLRPDMPAPLCVCARARHTHIDSTQSVYAGLSFEFGSRAEHREFVVDQICKYVAQIQRDQLARQRQA